MPEDFKNQLERIIWHAMKASINSTKVVVPSLAEAKAAPPSIDGNYNLMYLGNAVDAITELFDRKINPGRDEAVERVIASTDALRAVFKK